MHCRTGGDRFSSRIIDGMIAECGERAAFYDAKEQRDNEQLDYVNNRVREKCGVDGNDSSMDYLSTPKKTTKKTNRLNAHPYMNESSSLRLSDLTKKEVKRRTGFDDISLMLSFIVIICGGDMNVLTKTCSKLTWLEEWLLYLQYVYGHSINRWIDYEKEYNLDRKHCRRVFRSHLKLVISARNIWPMYATHEEDMKFRSNEWNEQVGDRRIIMHDNTNIGMPTASDADQQRSLYSEYYAECCAKGGVYLQLCGLIRASYLVTGHATDDKCTELTKILEIQQKFQEHDRKADDEKIKSFVIVLDKGYRITLDAKDCLQLVLQPVFASSDQQFTSNNLLLSAGVAVIRSGNERGVRYMKHSWIVSRGIKHGNFDLAVVDDLWMAWGFQVNFMYETLL